MNDQKIQKLEHKILVMENKLDMYSERAKILDTICHSFQELSDSYQQQANDLESVMEGYRELLFSLEDAA